MTESTAETQNSRRFDLGRAIAILIRPRPAFEATHAEARPTWLTPMLILSLTVTLYVVVGGYLKAQAAMLGEVTYPPGWEYWTPEMQNNFLQAQQLNQGPVITYVFPLVSSLARLWGGWVVVAGMLHLGSTLLGGRGTMQSALNVAAWASLPFALRDVLRVIYVFSAQHSIVSPGLSGFATSAFMAQILSHTDIFLIWSSVLLIIGIAITDGLPRPKAIVDVLVVMLLVLLTQAGLGLLMARIGSAFV